MRFGFITCVTLGLSCIDELTDIGAELSYLGTLRDDLSVKKSGRVYLDETARDLGVPVNKFRNVNDPDALESIRKADLDWLYIIGWSQIARAEVLSAPRRGAIGMHPTLLPEGRGRASIPWAIIKGLDHTGVSMFQLDAGVDTGPLLGQEKIPISATETSTSLYRKVGGAHRRLIRNVHPQLAEGTITPRAQDESRASVWPGRTPADGELFPSAMTVAEIDRMVRALTRPYPGAFIVRPDGVLRIWAGQTSKPANDGCSVTAKDGTFWVTEFDLEN